MNTHMIAREAVEIADVLEQTRYVEDQHVPVLLEDVRARLDFMGMSLEDVVLAGIYRVGRVPAKIAAWAEHGYHPETFLTTANWRKKISETLDFHSGELAWRYRTFLKVLLTQDAITPKDLIYANSILELDASIHDEENAAFAREEAEAAAARGHDQSPPTQLNLV